MEVKSRIIKALRWKVVPLMLVLCVTMAAQALTNVRSVIGSGSLTTQDLNDTSEFPPGAEAEALADLMTGSGINIIGVNIPVPPGSQAPTYAGQNQAAGKFTVISPIPDFDFVTGAILSSGFIADIDGQDSDKSQQSYGGTPGDSDLSDLFGGSTRDAAVLEFSFTADSNEVECTFAYGAEEYNERVGSKFNNEFAIWIDVHGDGSYQHNTDARSLIPGSTYLGPDSLVRINTVNGGKPSTCSNKKDDDGDRRDLGGGKDSTDPDCFPVCDNIVGEDNVNTYLPDADDTSGTKLFINNDMDDPDACDPFPRDIEADGFTKAIKFTVTLEGWEVGKEYSIKLAIADSRNKNFSSWLFVEADSFRTPSSCDDEDNDGWGYPGSDLSGCSGSTEVADNCPEDFNPGSIINGTLTQSDSDLDGDGDACDPCDADPLNDDDGDGFCAELTDFERDELLMVKDNCPEDSNDQSDDDGDGIGNLCDNCPDDPNGPNDDENQLDSDGDGIGDVCDDNDVPAELQAVILLERPADPDTTDFDGDGLFETQEDAIGTFDDDSDSDDDGYSDGSITDPDGIHNPGGSSVPFANDNCPVNHNPGQSDSDGDGIGDVCDDDDDNDGMSDLADNCPLISNPDQNNLDVILDNNPDGLGDVCDDDADGDGFLAVNDPVQDDCDDLNHLVYPGADEVKDNGKDDDCDPFTPDTDLDIVIAVSAPFNFDSDSNGIDDIWLPEDGDTVTLTPTVVIFPGTGVILGTPTVTFSVVSGSVTNYPGKYTNDSSTDPSADFIFDGIDLLTSHDYGGKITIHAEALVDIDTDNPPDGIANTVGVLVEVDKTIPADSDGDDLPDEWEALYGDLLRDGDSEETIIDPVTNEVSTHIGDGLTNFEEYRGVKWVQLDLDSSGTYKTPAYVPQSTESHFRTDPNRKDLFVEYTGYDTTNPFAIGVAFYYGRVDVHAADSTLTSSLGTSNIDTLLVTNDLVNTLLNVNGHINKKSGFRKWTWDTKGSSNLGGGLSYGLDCKTYQRALDGYFNDKPYVDGCVFDSSGTACSTSLPHPNSVLDPIGLVEDKDDSGAKNGSEARQIVNNGVLDGDFVVKDTVGDSDFDGIPNGFDQHLSPFDIDKDGFVELPVLTDPAVADPLSMTANEYTKAQVLKHTITHEIGHAVGLPHIADSLGLMYEYSINWSRDGIFSTSSLAKILIHNN